MTIPEKLEHCESLRRVLVARLLILKGGGHIRNWENVKFETFQKLNTGNNFFVDGRQASALKEDTQKDEYSSCEEKNELGEVIHQPVRHSSEVLRYRSS